MDTRRERCAHGLRVAVFTTRYPDDLRAWLREDGLDSLVDEVTDQKAAAYVFLDDRAVCFRGDFDQTLRDIDRLAAHWESPA